LANGKLLISLRSREQLAAATGAATWWYLLLGLCAWAGGIVLVALELLN
jgi:hypothetical protein